MDEEIKQARERLMHALPAIDLGAEMAKIEVPGGTVQLAIIAKAANGSGRITTQFEYEGFIKDIAIVLGFKDLKDLEKHGMEALDAKKAPPP